MSETTNDSIFDELPVGLRQAVIATNQQAPDRDAELRAVTLATRIADDERSAPSQTAALNQTPLAAAVSGWLERCFAKPGFLAVLAIGALIVGSILLIPMDLHVILHGQLTLRQLEFGETEWAIEADVDEYQLEQLHTHPIKAGESFDVRYFLSSEPEKKRDGWLSLNEVDAAESRMQNGKSTIFVNISQKADWVRPHPATAATVKVAFDRKPLGYAWIYQLIRFTRSHWRF